MLICCRRRTPHVKSPSKSVCIRRMAVLALLASTLACARPPQREPVTLTFLDIEWDMSTRPLAAEDLQAFTRATGIQVKAIPRPDGSLNQLALWRELLQKGSTGPDVLGIDVIWTGILNQYLADLTAYFSAELASAPPDILASYTMDDKVLAIPHHAYMGVLLYRTDLLQRYGYPEPPRTWTELEAMASRIQSGERARGNKDFWGFVWQGAVGEGLTCAGLEWQMSEGGGRIIEDDKVITVNNTQAVLAWERARRWVGSISPPSVVSYAKWDADNAWSSGNTAFLRGWASDDSLITGLTPPPAGTTRYGVTSVPGGRVGRSSTLGGNGLAVSRASAHPHEAIELIRFLRRRDVERARSSAQQKPPARLELYELPSVLKPFAVAPASKRPGGSAVARPSVVAGQLYEAVTKAYIREVRSVVTGEKPASVAAESLEQELVRITGFRRGPPRHAGQVAP
jgi:trehalose/maltose transport system substrate-binding protein